MSAQLKATKFLPRHLSRKLTEALADTRVVSLLGPRQSGKSTLAQHCEPGRAYVNLDDHDNFELARRDPKGFIAEQPERVTIDEIQRVPELLLVIKYSVDFDKAPGRFLLTGSANLLQLPRLADSLAGRMECLYLQPFTEAEKAGSAGNFLETWMSGKLSRKIPPSRALAKSELPQRMVAGGYPEAVRRSPERARDWQRQYVQSIIERDIYDIADVKDGQDVARLLEYLSNQTASLLNIANAANELRHTRPTIERYLGILEKLFLIRRLPAWHSSRNKRLVKTPKVHLCDSGLAAALSGLEPDQWISERTRFGHLLESFVLQQLVAMAGWGGRWMHFYHYRDKDQVEVDVVIEVGGQVWGVEIKATTTFREGDAQGLRRLAESAGKNFRGGIVLYDGNIVWPIDEKLNILAVPLAMLWDL